MGKAMAEGKVIEIAGTMVDIEFPSGAVPDLYNAVEIEADGGCKVVGEVQERLGSNAVRVLTYDSTDGLRPGARAVDTGGPMATAASY